MQAFHYFQVLLMYNKKYLWFISVPVISAVLYCYNPFLLYFQNDDFVHIALSRQGALMQRNSFRPICDLSIILDYYIWAKNAWGYHLTNLLLHITNSLFVFFLSRTLFKRYKLFEHAIVPSVLSSLLFFTYSMHSEAVFWILGRSAALGSLFFSLCLLCYFKKENKLYFIAGILFSILSWLSYESTWILPFIILLISFIDSRVSHTSFKKNSRFFFIIIFFFVIYLFARYSVIHEVAGQYEAASFLGFDFKRLAENFIKLAIRSWLPYSENAYILIIPFACLMIFTGFILLLIKEKRLTVLLLLFVWVIALLPCLSLGADTKGTEGERFLYLPSVFVCMAVVVLIGNIHSPLINNIFITVLLLGQIIFLYNNAKNYRFAGNVVHATIEQINLLNDRQRLLVDSLPQRCHGALIFRSGFEDAVQWMKNSGTVDTVIILSRRKSDLPLRNEYRITSAQLKPDFNFNEKTDAYFLFSENALLVNK